MRQIKVQTSHIKQKKASNPKMVDYQHITKFVDGNFGCEILSKTSQKCQKARDSKM